MFKKIIRRNMVQIVIVFVVTFSIFYALEFNSRNPYFSGYDSFYHIGMSELIMKEGFTRQFPYLYFTTINKNFSDNHLLFHLLMIPFIKLFGDVVGPKLFIVLTFSLVFVFLFILLKRLNFAWALPFTFIAFFLEPSDFYFRMAFIRDPTPSLLFLVVGLFLVYERRYVAIGILSFLYGWLYTGGGFLFLLTYVIIYEGISLLTRKKLNWKMLIYSTLGTALSLVINPYFPANVKSIFLQIFQTGLQAKQYSGGEWYPYDTWFWFSISYIPLIICFGAIGIALYKGIKISRFSLSVFIFSLFLMVLLWKSKRFIELWPFFAILSGILIAGKQLEEWVKQTTNRVLREHFKKHKLHFIVLLLGIGILGSTSLVFARGEWSRAWKDTAMDYNVDKAKEAQEFLKSKSNPGDIVFTDDWDVFPLYFYLNQKDYYIVGLDPEFMNQFDHNLYIQFAAISSGNDNKNLERIKDLFKSKWVIVKFDHAEFIGNLRARKDLFDEVFSNGEYFVFKVKG